MFHVYLAASLIGAVLLVASLVLGGHGVGHDVDASGAGGHEAGAASLALQFFSVRFWTYVLAFGGGTGVLLRWLAGVGEPLAALVAASVGFAAATAARFALLKAAGGQASGTVTTGDLVGRTAGVVVPFGKGTTGKVRVRVRGEQVDMLALTDDGAELGASDEVLIVEVRDGSAVVTLSPEAPHSRKR